MNDSYTFDSPYLFIFVFTCVISAISVISIDDDILSLIDEVEIDKVLREAAEAFVDERRFTKYIRQKCVLAISRFLVSFEK